MAVIIVIGILATNNPPQKFVSDSNGDSNIGAQVQQALNEITNLYSGRYAGIKCNMIFLEKDGEEISVRNDAVGTKILMYRQIKDGAVARIEGIEPKLGTPVTIYAKLENDKQIVMRIVINSQEDAS